MRIMEQAVEVIENSEKALRKLLAEAAQEGDYSALMQLTAWAHTLQSIVSGENLGVRSVGRKLRTTLIPQERERSKSSTTRKNKEKDPEFFREGEELVLVAWSKTKKQKYRHKIAFQILEVLILAMLEKGDGGRVFRTDELLPLRNSCDGTEYPHYKTYVGISFLKHFAAIEQHGRSGYSIPHISTFESTVRSLWEELPKME